MGYIYQQMSSPRTLATLPSLSSRRPAMSPGELGGDNSHHHHSTRRGGEEEGKQKKIDMQ